MNPEPPLNWAPRQEPLGQPAAPVPVSPPPYQPTYHQPPKKRRTWLMVVGLAAAVLVALAGMATVLVAVGGVHLPGMSSGFESRGMITVTDCNSPGYSDVRVGTEVTLTDESGKVLAVSSLTGGGAACTFHFTLENIPAGAKFYGITISHRGTVHFTEAQLRAGPELSLGD